MPKTKLSWINNEKALKYFINGVRLEPSVGLQLWKNLGSTEQFQLLRNSKVRDLVRNDPDYQQFKLDHKEKRENIEKIKSMTPAKRVIELHNSPKYDNLYSHQKIFQDTLIKNYADNSDTVEKMGAVLSMIDMIELCVTQFKNTENRRSVSGRSIVYGGDIQQSTNGTMGADGVLYGRNKSYDGLPREGRDYVLIDDIIAQLESVGITEDDAIRLIVLRLGLGKYGGQNSNGEFFVNGNYGLFVYSCDKDGNVRYFFFDDVRASRSSYWQNYASTILTIKTAV